MKKKIISLTTCGITFNLGEVVDEGMGAPEVSGRRVNHIEFKRDAVYNISKGVDEEAHYMIVLMHPMTDKDVVYTLVPFSKVDRLSFITEEEDDDKPSEVADKMKKVD